MLQPLQAIACSTAWRHTSSLPCLGCRAGCTHCTMLSCTTRWTTCSCTAALVCVTKLAEYLLTVWIYIQEDNHANDLSSTELYQRNSFLHFTL